MGLARLSVQRCSDDVEEVVLCGMLDDDEVSTQTSRGRKMASISALSVDTNKSALELDVAMDAKAAVLVAVVSVCTDEEEEVTDAAELMMLVAGLMVSEDVVGLVAASSS